jgi:uncharacterized membrane protein (UPF0136 family)
MSGKIPGSAHLNLSLGGLVIVGGCIGYFRKGSRMSLIAGVSLGSLLLGSGYMIAKTDYVYEGHVLASTTSGIMSIAMGQRYLQTMKFMPSGMVATLGTLACAYNVMKAMEWAPTAASKRGMSMERIYLACLIYKISSYANFSFLQIKIAYSSATSQLTLT